MDPIKGLRQISLLFAEPPGEERESQRGRHRETCRTKTSIDFRVATRSRPRRYTKSALDIDTNVERSIAVPSASSTSSTPFLGRLETPLSQRRDAIPYCQERNSRCAGSPQPKESFNLHGQEGSSQPAPNLARCSRRVTLLAGWAAANPQPSLNPVLQAEFVLCPSLSRLGSRRG